MNKLLLFYGKFILIWLILDIAGFELATHTSYGLAGNFTASYGFRAPKILVPFEESATCLCISDRLLEIPSSDRLNSKQQEMDTSNPAVIVNGDLLRNYVGRRVRTVLQVVRPDAGGLIGRSTDEKQVTVKGQPPSLLTTFVEVIGVADSAQSIRAEIVTNFGDTFDTNNFNQLCQLANGEFRHLFI
ncbi:hypothetical protein L2E82_12465 [Cichorium intybus]|uniref:Uncharacterized protein n=1 Tax=Cichorium intybus TaxID=13427 RepID=A0ACB9GHD4_CICIN|nr:hypothetical protein L2E82_12465 [Cichorium intybus]